MTLTRNAIGNLINRYKAVLGKCRLLNTFGSLAVAAALTMGGADAAWAEEITWGNDQDVAIGYDDDNGDIVSQTETISSAMEAASLTIRTGSTLTINNGSVTTGTKGYISVDGSLEINNGSVTTGAEGSISVDGSLEINGGRIETPVVDFGDGAKGTFSGNVALRGVATTPYVSQGDAEITISENGSLTVSMDYAQNGGTIVNHGKITVDAANTFSQSGGEFTNNGQFIVNTRDGDKNRISVQSGGTITNSGTFTVAQDAVFQQYDDGVFSNTGTFNVDQDAVFQQYGGVFSNTGTLNVEGNVKLGGTVTASDTSIVNIKSSLALSSGNFFALQQGKLNIGAEGTNGATLLHTGSNDVNSATFDTTAFGTNINFNGSNSNLEISDGYGNFGNVTIKGAAGKDSITLGNNGTIRANDIALNHAGDSMQLQHGTLIAVAQNEAGSATISKGSTGDKGTLILGESGKLTLGETLVNEDGSETRAEGGQVNGNITVSGENGALHAQSGPWEINGIVIIDNKFGVLTVGKGALAADASEKNASLQVNGRTTVKAGKVETHEDGEFIVAEDTAYVQTGGTFNNAGAFVVNGKAALRDDDDVDVTNTGSIQVINRQKTEGADRGILEIASGKFADLWEQGKLLIGGRDAAGISRVDVLGDASLKTSDINARNQGQLTPTGIEIGDYGYLNVSGTLDITGDTLNIDIGSVWGGGTSSITAHAMNVADNLTLIGNVYIDGQRGQGVSGSVGGMDSGIVVANSGSLTVNGNLTLGDRPWKDSDTPDPLGGDIKGSLVLGPTRKSKLVVAGGQWTISKDLDIEAESEASVAAGELTVSGTTTLDGGTITVASGGTLKLQAATATDNAGSIYVGESDASAKGNAHLYVTGEDLKNLRKNFVSISVTGKENAYSHLHLASVDAPEDGSFTTEEINASDYYRFMNGYASLDGKHITLTDTADNGLILNATDRIEASEGMTLTQDPGAVGGPEPVFVLHSGELAVKSGTLNGDNVKLQGGKLTLGEKIAASDDGLDAASNTGDHDGTIATDITVAAAAATVNVESGTWTVEAGKTVSVNNGALIIGGNIDGDKVQATLRVEGALTSAQDGTGTSVAAGEQVKGINVMKQGVLSADSSKLLNSTRDGRVDNLAAVYVAEGGTVAVTNHGWTTVKMAKFESIRDALFVSGSSGLLNLVGATITDDEADRSDIVVGGLAGPSIEQRGVLLENNSAVYEKGEKDSIAEKGGYGVQSIVINGDTPVASVTIAKNDVTLLGRENMLVTEKDGKDVGAIHIGTADNKASLNLGNKTTAPGSGTSTSDIVLDNKDSELNAVNGSYTVGNVMAATDDYGLVSAVGAKAELHASKIGENDTTVNTVEAKAGGQIASGGSIHANNVNAASGGSVTAGNPIYATFISATGEKSLVESTQLVQADTITAGNKGTVQGQSLKANTINLADGTVQTTGGDLVVTHKLYNDSDGKRSANGNLLAQNGNIDLKGGADSQGLSLKATGSSTDGKGDITFFENNSQQEASTVQSAVADNKVNVQGTDKTLGVTDALSGTLNAGSNTVNVGPHSDKGKTASITLKGASTAGTLDLKKTEGTLGPQLTVNELNISNGSDIAGNTVAANTISAANGSKLDVATLTAQVPGTAEAPNSIEKISASGGSTITAKSNPIYATFISATGDNSLVEGKQLVQADTITASDKGTVQGKSLKANTINLADGTVQTAGGDLVVTGKLYNDSDGKRSANGTLLAQNGNIDLQGGATSTDLKVTAANGTIAFGDSAVDSKAASVAAKTIDINGKSLTAADVTANRVNANNDGLTITKRLAADTLVGKLTVANGGKAFIANPGAVDNANKTMTVANAAIKVNPGGLAALGYDVTAPNAENNFVQNMTASMGRATNASGAPSAVLYLDRPAAVAPTASISVGGASASAGGVAFADNSLLVVNGNNGSATTPYLTASGAISGLAKASLDVQHMDAGQEIRLFADGVAQSSDFADGRNVTTDNLLVSASYRNGMITTAQVQAQQALPGLDGKLATLIDASGGQIGPEHVNSPQGGVKFLSRAVSRGYGYDNPTEAAKAVEGAARTLAVAAVPQMAMGANTAGANAVTQRTSLTAPASPLQSMNASGEVSGLNSGDETGLNAGNDYKSGFGMWVMPLWQSSNGFGLKAGNYKMDYSGNVAGVALGADYTVEDTVRAGVTFNIGGGHSEGSGDFGKTTNNMNFWGVGAYVGMMADELGLTADINYTSSFNDIKQELPASFAMGNLNGEVRSSAISTGLRAEYKFETEALDVIPHAAVRYTALHSDSFSMKSGGQSVAKTNATDQNIWSFPVGVTVAKSIDTGNGWHVRPSLDLTVTPTTGDVDNRQKIKFTGLANKATMESQVMDRVTYGGQAGLEFGNDAIQLGLNYNLQVGEHTTNHGVFGTFRYNF